MVTCTCISIHSGVANKKTAIQQQESESDSTYTVCDMEPLRKTQTLEVKTKTTSLD